MISDSITAIGKVALTLRDANGNVKQQTYIDNMVVSVGKSLIASRLVGVSSAVMSHMELGTSTANASLMDITLGAAIAGSRMPIATSTVVGNEITYTATFSAGIGTGKLAEVGLFNSVTVGTMLARTTYNAFDKLAADTLDVVWKITIN